MGSPTRLHRLLNTTQIRRDYSIKPAGLRWRSKKIFIIATVAVGIFSDLALYSLFVPVLPYMLQDRIGLPKEKVQSHVSGLLAAYAGASCLCSPLAGILADRMSTRQAPFLGGLLTLLGATALFFAGRSVPVLVISRLLQGISGAFVWTIGLAICLETVGPKNLGKTIGTIFSITSVATLAAPTVGGLLYEKTGYAGVFGLSFAVLVIDLIMRILVIEVKVARRYGQDDGESTSHEHGASSNEHEQDADEETPLIDARKSELDEYKLSSDLSWIARRVSIIPCLSNPRLLTALLVALVQAILLGSFDATVPIIGQEYFDFSPLKAGVLFLPLGIFDLVLGPVFGWCVDRFGTKPVAVGTYSFLVPVLALLRLPQPGGLHQMLLYGGLLALGGMGLAGIGAPSIVEAGMVVQKYYDANPEFYGENGPYAQLYGLNSMVFSAGLTLGPELAGELKQAIGYGNMNAVLAGLCAVTALVSWGFMGGRPRLLHRRQTT